MDPTTTTKTPRTRSSCEDCGSAKVKCDRGQSECSRCISLNLKCVYGISRKAGKPPRKRLLAPSDKANQISCKKQEIGSCESYSPVEFSQSQTTGNPTQLRSAHAATNVLPVPPSLYQLGHFNSPFNAPLSIDEWPELETWDPNPDFSFLQTSPSTETQHPHISTQPTNPSTSLDSPSTHSCSRGSYELFRDLICPGPLLHAPELTTDTVSARLDDVLHFNRDAIERLNRLLKCPCAKSGHRIMVHASTISRILIWYQQAAGWNGGGSAGTLPSSSDSSSSSDSGSEKSPMQVPPTGFAVAQVPLSMGTFRIEDENLQAVIRNQLVLSELKKAAKLIECFICQDFSETSGCGVTGLYSHLGVWLQGEHSKTVKMLRDRISDLNEALQL